MKVATLKCDLVQKLCGKEADRLKQTSNCSLLSCAAQTRNCFQVSETRRDALNSFS